MWEHNHGDLPPCFSNYFKKQAMYINMPLAAHRVTIGPKCYLVFSIKISFLDFYKKCKKKNEFKRNIKDFL